MMMVHSPQGDIPGGQQWIPGGHQWTYNCPNPSYGAQTPTHNLNSQPQMHAHHPQDMKNIQQQVQNLQHQVQHLLSNPALSRSVIGSISLANSGKSSILSVLSLLSTPDSYQNSWILDSRTTDHMTPVVDKLLSYELCITEQNVQTVDSTLLKVAGIAVCMYRK